MHISKNKHGFTIVELLIVVVVIAILAAITIVAYNGIQNRAKQSAAQSAVSQVSKKVLLYAVEHADAYPDTLQDISVSDSAQASYQYNVNNSASPRTFCVTATVQNFSYYQSSTQQNPTAGACTGHGLNGLPPNLASNPSFETEAGVISVRPNLTTNPSLETNATGWGIVNGGTGASIATSTAQAHSGSRSLEYTFGNGTAQDAGPSAAITATAGATYTISAWVYVPASISGGIRMIVFGTAVGNTERGASDTTVGSWVRVSYTVTTPNAGTLSYIIAKTNGTTDTGKLLYVDSVSVEQSPAINSYFSGATSPSGDFTYEWSGTQHASTSSERALSVANYSQNGIGLARFRSAERSVSGNYSARVALTTTASNPGLYQSMVLNPGTYTFIAKIWSDPAIGALTAITIQGTGVSVGAVAGYPSSTNTQGEWVELRRTVTIPAATNLNFFVYMPGTVVSVGNSFWVDDFAIVSGTCTATVCY